MRSMDQKTTLTRAFHLAHLVNGNGTCLEFGVFWGRSYVWQAERIMRQYPRSRLIGFDSWQGLPAEDRSVWTPERHAEGQFKADKESVLEQLKVIGAAESGDDRFRLVDGFFKDSLTPQLAATIRDLIFINIDVDLFASAVEVLEFIGPLLRPGTVIYWDDWQDPNDDCDEPWGERLAWDTWHPKQSFLAVETMEVNPVNQRSMMVTAACDGRAVARLTHRQIADIRYALLDMDTSGDPLKQGEITAAAPTPTLG